MTFSRTFSSAGLISGMCGGGWPVAALEASTA